MRNSMVPIGLVAALISGPAFSAETKPAPAETTKPTAAEAPARDADPCVPLAKTTELTQITPEAVCALISSAIAESRRLPSGDAGRSIAYNDSSIFYGTLSKSLSVAAKVRAPDKPYPVLVVFPSETPAITVDRLRTLQPPEYKQTGIGVWLDRIESTGGKICVTDSDQGLPAAAIPLIFDFAAKYVVPWLIRRYKAAQTYKPASYYDAQILRVKPGAGPMGGRILEIKFAKRGTLTCS